jgi:hypothetical protein
LLGFGSEDTFPWTKALENIKIKGYFTLKTQIFKKKNTHMKWLNAFLIELVEVLSSLKQENVKTKCRKYKKQI